jgi:hypothetical protein
MLSMPSRRNRVFTVAIAAKSSAGFAGDTAQPTANLQADYPVAAALLPGNIVPMIKNTKIVPQWIGTRDEFWYQQESKAGHGFVIVTATTGRPWGSIRSRRAGRCLDPGSGSTGHAGSTSL